MSKNKIAATEIELKFLLGQTLDAKAVTEVLFREKFRFKQAQASLKNCYFDTPALDLARSDMGLRIRSLGALYEQTIKTSGRVFSGLHQRPEYNIAFTHRQAQTGPVLSLFPATIWLPGQDPVRIQSKLSAIFTTDFHRTSWTLDMGSGSVIELVLDTGLISVMGSDINRQAKIAEFELELLSGSGPGATHALIALAELLCRHFKLRPGLKSKAARGYALWLGAPEKEQQALAFSEESFPGCPDREAFYSQLQLALNKLQHGVEAFVLSACSKHLVLVRQCLLFLAHVFEHGASCLPSRVILPGAQLDEVIQSFMEKFTEAGLPGGERPGWDIQGMIDFFYGQNFNLLQLALLKLLLEKVQLSE